MKVPNFFHPSNRLDFFISSFLVSEKGRLSWAHLWPGCIQGGVTEAVHAGGHALYSHRLPVGPVGAVGHLADAQVGHHQVEAIVGAQGRGVRLAVLQGALAALQQTDPAQCCQLPSIICTECRAKSLN
jgi:hypothetical protein